MSDVLQKTTIRELDPIEQSVMLVGVLIAKQTPKKINSGEVERAVWNFTIRDSPLDSINVAFWSTHNTLIGLHNCLQIGDTVEVRSPRIMVRRPDDIGEKYRPQVSSAFHLVVNETEGTVNAISNNYKNDFSALVHVPIKPVINYMSLAQIERNIKQMNGQVADLFVAVRQIGPNRFVNTRDGLKEVRNFVVFDNTSPGMGITLWEREYVHRSSFWKPRLTILYMTDMRINYDSYSKGPKASMTMRTVITENPVGPETGKLREYAKNAVLQTSALLDQLTASLPDATTVRTVMNIQQIYEKVNEIVANTVTRVEDQQFAVILYAFIINFDLDGLNRLMTTRCSSCRSIVNEDCICENSLCLVNGSMGGSNTLKIETSFDIRLQLSDHTGGLPNCRLTGKAVEDMLECTVEEFAEKSAEERGELKWKYLMERCELRVMIWAKSSNPIITIISCKHANLSEIVQHL